MTINSKTGNVSRSQSVNKVITQSPKLEGTYVHCTPRWLMQTVRAMFAIFGIATIYFLASARELEPIGQKVFFCVLSLVFLAVSTWPRPWRQLTKFIACKQGIYFPNNSQLVLVLGQPILDEWLFIPWSRIRNLRLSREAGGDNAKCVAFDVEVSNEEQERFFKHVDKPRDRNTTAAGIANLAYCDYPPSPKKTLSILESMISISKN